MKIALGAKVKLSFIDGRCQKPAESSPDYNKWCKVDCMVTLWILNSISNETVDAFLHASSANQLWKKIEDRYVNVTALYSIN